MTLSLVTNMKLTYINDTIIGDANGVDNDKH